MAHQRPSKVDFDVIIAQDTDISVTSIKPGQELTVALDERSGSLRCCTADGALLGTVPDSVARQLHGGIRVTVRSVKKQVDAPDKVAGVQARAVPADPAAAAGRSAAAAASQAAPQQPQRQQAAPIVQPDDPSGFAVTVSQLQQLGVCNQERTVWAFEVLEATACGAAPFVASASSSPLTLLLSRFDLCTVSLFTAADNPAMVLTLRDERLQQLLLRIDNAPDRAKVRDRGGGEACRRGIPPVFLHALCVDDATPTSPHPTRCLARHAQALEQALEQEPFRNFADQVLGLIAEKK